MIMLIIKVVTVVMVMRVGLSICVRVVMVMRVSDGRSRRDVREVSDLVSEYSADGRHRRHVVLIAYPLREQLVANFPGENAWVLQL